MEIKVGFLGVLTIVFVTLKLTGAIAWSWLWVLAPLWIPIAIVIAAVVFCLAIGLVAVIVGLLIVAILTPIMGRKWVSENVFKIKARFK